MILTGSQRGGARQLAAHLLSTENDHVTVHEVRGFASTDLTGAFVEAQAISKATNCRQFLFSLSLSPPPDATVSIEAFEEAVRQVEDALELTGQPRAIVFHEKNGRRHAHVVWSRIDAKTMTAKQMSFYKMKLRTVSTSLFLEHGWMLPAGLADSQKRDPRNFTLQDWLQAKRAKQDPSDIKQALQDAWQISDTLPAYQNALEKRGYKLARGDRRGYVAVDFEGNVYAIARWTGIKTKEVRMRLGTPSDLPSISQQREAYAQEIAPRINAHLQEAKTILDTDLANIDARRQALVEAQKRERAALKERQTQRAREEQDKRLSHYRTGLKGLLDRLTGRRAKLKAANQQDMLRCLKRDQSERDALIFQHIDARQRLAIEKAEALENYKMVRSTLLSETMDTEQSDRDHMVHQKHHHRDDELRR